MSYAIDAGLKNAVNHFKWDQTILNAPLPSAEVLPPPLTLAISKEIIALSNLRQDETIPLVTLCYAAVQNLDSKRTTPLLLKRIEEVTPDQQTLLSHTFKNLSAHFIQIAPQDLKAMTLLFGITQITDLATERFAIPPLQQDQISQKKEMLSKLLKMRNQYANVSLPENQKIFLQKIDEGIAKITEELDALKAAA